MHTTLKSYFANFAGLVPSGSYVGTDVCVHSPESINGCKCVTEKAHCCVLFLLLLQQCELVLADMCKVEI